MHDLTFKKLKKTGGWLMASKLHPERLDIPAWKPDESFSAQTDDLIIIIYMETQYMTRYYRKYYIKQLFDRIIKRN